MFGLARRHHQLEAVETGFAMKFYVAKCHSMRVSQHQHYKHTLFNYSLHDQTLENEL